MTRALYQWCYQYESLKNVRPQDGSSRPRHCACRHAEEARLQVRCLPAYEADQRLLLKLPSGRLDVFAFVEGNNTHFVCTKSNIYSASKGY